MPVPTRGPGSLETINRHLDDAVIPVRLAMPTVSGFPLVLSLWFVRQGGDVWCATHQSARALRHLARDGRCGFEVARDSKPYHGVRGRAVASVHPEAGAAVLDALIARYLTDDDASLARWLRSRRAEEVAIRLRPTRLESWDYRSRMAE
jgi:hypothetical protein